MDSFEDLVRDNTITGAGLRPEWAGHVIAALRYAGESGRGNGLTPEERGILHCLRLRVEGRVDQPDHDHLEYAGTMGLLGWVMRIILDDPRIAEREPQYRALVAQFRRTLRDYHKAAAQGEPPPQA